MENNEEKLQDVYEYNDGTDFSAAESTPKKVKKKKAGALIAAFVAVALVAGVGGAFLSKNFIKLQKKEDAQTVMSEEPVIAHESVEENKFSLEGSELPEKLKTNTGDKSLTAAEVYENNVDAVVGIRTEGITTNIWGQVTQSSSAGTGFILTDDGYIVTNNHVISGGKTVTVALYNGDEYEATLVAGDDVNDVALLKIDAEGLQTVAIGKSEDLTVGEEVVAIGNPLGELTFTMTHGYISALDRYINTSGTPINMLQTDAAINAGNSGGPLFDMNGNVIAMNTAKPSSSTANGTTVEGIGFAIPIDDVLNVVYELRENGRVTGRAFLGITPKDLDKSTADTYHLPVGVYVVELVDGYCAQKAGMEEGDIILSINGKKVDSTTDLRAELNRLKAGDETTVVVYRAGEEVQLKLTLDEAPEQEEQQTQSPQQSGGYYGYSIDPNEFFREFAFGY